MHEHIIILSIEFDQVPHVSLLKNATVTKLDKYTTLIIIHYGYMDTTDIPDALRLLNQTGVAIDFENAIYFLGRESVVVTKHTGMSPFRETVFEYLGRNSARITSYFNLPYNKVFEIGSRIKL